MLFDSHVVSVLNQAFGTSIWKIAKNIRRLPLITCQLCSKPIPSTILPQSRSIKCIGTEALILLFVSATRARKKYKNTVSTFLGAEMWHCHILLCPDFARIDRRPSVAGSNVWNSEILPSLRCFFACRSSPGKDTPALYSPSFPRVLAFVENDHLPLIAPLEVF